MTILACEVPFRNTRISKLLNNNEKSGRVELIGPNLVYW
jgi:hypothetical protein